MQGMALRRDKERTPGQIASVVACRGVGEVRQETRGAKARRPPRKGGGLPARPLFPFCIRQFMTVAMMQVRHVRMVVY